MRWKNISPKNKLKPTLIPSHLIGSTEYKKNHRGQFLTNQILQDEI